MSALGQKQQTLFESIVQKSPLPVDQPLQSKFFTGFASWFARDRKRSHEVILLIDNRKSKI